MGGIYIHIPFCRKACNYCNFHFSVSLKLIQQITNAICKEAELRQSYISEKIDTIYFGGGTPSLLSDEQLIQIIQTPKDLFEWNNEIEITLEVNPDDINPKTLSGWKRAGINRLSIGVQSFYQGDLLWMNRVHNAEQSVQSIQLAQQAGFNNISIDLIYGLPALTDEQWQLNIQKALKLNVQHLSCYALTVEPRTALYKSIAQNNTDNIDEEKQSRHFHLLMKAAAENGFEQYEISNFAKSGFRSKHNSSYWQGKPYLGLGPSAHSFNSKSRQWNISNNSLYVLNIEKGIVPFEIELLTPVQQLNEYIMTSLRTIEGVSTKKLSELADENVVLSIEHDAQKHIDQNMLVNNNSFLQLTSEGKFFADGIAADLFRTSPSLPKESV